jgi:uncharacterized protein (TIGR02996 family)
MSLKRSFLADILANPEDDTPRLVFADWLDEHDQSERADFIRVQVELAKMPGDDPRRAPLKQREEQLRKAHAGRWRRQLPRLDGVVWGQTFQRGFPVEVKFANAVAFGRHADVAFAATPVEMLRFRSLSPRTLERVAGSAHLAHLTHLDLRGHLLDDDGMQALAKARCPRLRTLWLSGNAIGNAGALALAGWPSLATLRELLLLYNRIGAEGAQALATSPYVTELTDLTLSANPLGPEGVQAVAASANLGQLVVLSLFSTQGGDLGARSLAASAHLRRLNKLAYHHNQVSDAARAALVERFGEQVVDCALNA